MCVYVYVVECGKGKSSVERVGDMDMGTGTGTGTGERGRGGGGMVGMSTRLVRVHRLVRGWGVVV